MANLDVLFKSFTKGSDQMDGRMFAKLAKDCKIINKSCTPTDIDLIFAKSKDKAARKITFDQFNTALSFCAEKRKESVDALVSKVLAAGGPVFTGTKADAVALHDDKSNHTGVHGKGGPSTVDDVDGLAGLLDRSEADARGRKIDTAGATKGVKDMKFTDVKVVEKPRPKSPKKKSDADAPPPASADAPDGLQELFESFTKGSDQMDGRMFAKLAKDCKIINKSCTPTDIDLIFAKSKDKAARKITFDQFYIALVHCAEKRKESPASLMAKVLSSGGPVFTGTKTDAVALYDDKSNFTGVHGKGGPSTVDDTDGLAGILDRSDADARGVKK